MKRNIALLGILILTVAIGRAQEEKQTYNENVIVTGKYRPSIEMMNKVNVPPSAFDTATKLQHNFAYDLQPQRMTSLFTPSRIKAARIIAEPKSRLYNNYIKLGMGNYWSPLIEASYSSTNDRLTTYGAMLQHHSSWGSIGDKDNADEYYGANHFAQTALELFGHHLYRGGMQLYGTFHYDNDYNMFYGFADSTLNHYCNGLNGWPADSVDNWRDKLRNRDLRSMYNYFDLNAGLRSAPDSKSDWAYDAALGLADLVGSQGHNEFHFSLDGRVSRKLTLNQLPMVEHPAVAMRLQWHQLRHSYDLKNLPPYFTPAGTSGEMDYSRNRTLIGLNPYATFTIEAFSVHAGATLSMNQYTHDNTMKSYLLPDITVGRSLLDGTLALTAGAQGTDNPNTWNTMRLSNPYALGTDDVRSVRHYTYFLKGHYMIVKRLHLDAYVSYNRYHDYMTYELDRRFALENVFRPKYESFRQTVLGADLTFVNDEMITLTVGGTYYRGAAIDGDTLPGLYHPKYDLHLSTRLNYNDKWLVHLQGLLMSEMNADYGTNAAGKYVITETVPMRCAFSTEVEYRHNRALSFFLRVDNIACQRYQYWLHYPSQRIRFTLGATYTL